MSGRRRNEYRHIAVQLRQAAIKSGQLPLAVSRELREVGIRYLSVADHTADLDVGERDSVRPELVAVRILDCADDFPSSRRGLTRPDQEPNKTPLCDRARRKSCAG